ncbi:sigma-70 family RNA polymerase sigma factor [Ramlibacter sp.]|jgi:RNA polymerase sigma factor (sigma-70 family)|uniref:sigma-70 family RNA polymerase sigma factor n=1 Tax=Ramlibacter sp. TaxID=1917967 RepID=UPI00262CC594|nr:sigma-70 family RNA polymerase sigma factor [Ramlibacter sp.]MDB5958329.1 polymerase sigma factor [Ramlibacter sp.]
MAPPAASHNSLVGHIPDLRRYARSLTGDAWAADDLVQDTLERACERWQLWAAGSDLRAWLFTLMHNLFVDSARRAVRQQAGQRVDVDDVANELLSPAGVPDQVMDLQRCLLRLPPEQREVLLLVTLQDLGYQDAARITGVPIGTVMSRLSRARARLRDLMEGRAPGATPAAPALRRLK